MNRKALHSLKFGAGFVLCAGFVLAVWIGLAPVANACIGSNGTLPPFGGSAPNPIMVEKINAAWAAATAKGLESPLAPPISGVHRAVIILIENAAAGAPFAYPDPTLWSHRIAEIADYYTEVSRGLFTIAPAAESFGTANDGVIGPVTVSDLNASSDIASGGSKALAVAAIRAANPYIDFASFDTNHNGTIEADELHVLIYQAGDEAAFFPNNLPRAWAHMSSQSPHLTGLDPASDSDGENITSYCYCGSVLNGSVMEKMGVMTHELGHDIGLPDLYDADGSGSGGDWAGLGGFCLMAGGNWGGDSGSSPVHIDGYFKYWLGWGTQTVAAAPGNQFLAVAKAEGNNDTIRINVPGSQEFFIVENRRPEGYDAGMWISEGGLAIYHCDGSVLTDMNIRLFNSVNESPTYYGIALEEADGDNQLATISGYRGQNSDLYRAFGYTTLDASSNPNSNLKNGSASSVAISDVSAPGESMTFKLGSPTGSIQVSIEGPSAPLVMSGLVDYTVKYTNATSISLSAADVKLESSGNAEGTVSVSGTDASQRTVTISDVGGQGTLWISIAPGTASNPLGAVAPAAGPSDPVRIGYQVPVAAWPAACAILAAAIVLLRNSRKQKRTV